MAAQDRIRLTGLLRKSPVSAGLFYCGRRAAGRSRPPSRRATVGRRMPTRLVFRCELCRAEPEELTRISIERQLLHERFGEYVDAGPDGWLIWHGRGIYGGT